MTKQLPDEQADDLRRRLEMLARKEETLSNKLQADRKDANQLDKEGGLVGRTENELLATEKNNKSTASKQQRTENNASQVKSNYQSLNWERLLGQNISTKIGIVIILIALALGFRYCIEHGLIGTQMRVLLAYLFSAGLLAVSLWFKKKYRGFSAILISGALAISYFATYVAYSYYHFFAVDIGFVLLLSISVIAVFFALNYNLQLIAHFGLVGAYVLPFLTNNGFDDVLSLFIYICIVNMAVVILALKKYWKALYYLSFFSSWILFSLWSFETLATTETINIALIFGSVFFVTFYAVSVAYKLLKNQTYNLTDVVILMTNAFIYYGLVFRLLVASPTHEAYIGLFALGNALIHAVVSISIYKLRLADRNLFYFIAGLALIFVTMAIALQFDGSIVTILWACEALLLFWIGRTRQTRFYERVSYPVMLLAFMSVMQDWYALTTTEALAFEPFTNSSFFSSLFLIVVFIAINFFSYRNKMAEPPFKVLWVDRVVSVFAPLFLILILYFTFRVEISTYYQHLYALSELKLPVLDVNVFEQYLNFNLIRFKRIWLLNYSLLFMILLSVLNMLSSKNQIHSKIILFVNSLLILNFLTVGLAQLTALRVQYLSHTIVFPVDSSFIYIRYVCLFLLLSLLILSKRMSVLLRGRADIWHIKAVFELFFYAVLLWLSSSELIAWLELTAYSNNMNLAISILWGLYASILTVIGIWHRKKHLQWAAISLLVITVVKLFVYDLSL